MIDRGAGGSYLPLSTPRCRSPQRQTTHLLPAGSHTATTRGAGDLPTGIVLFRSSQADVGDAPCRAGPPSTALPSAPRSIEPGYLHLGISGCLGAFLSLSRGSYGPLRHRAAETPMSPFRFSASSSPSSTPPLCAEPTSPSPPFDEPPADSCDHRHRAASNQSGPVARHAPTTPNPPSAICSSDPHRLRRFRQTPP